MQRSYTGDYSFTDGKDLLTAFIMFCRRNDMEVARIDDDTYMSASDGSVLHMDISKNEFKTITQSSDDGNMMATRYTGSYVQFHIAQRFIEVRRYSENRPSYVFRI